MFYFAGIHPLRIAKGFEMACDIACKHLESIADTIAVTPDNPSTLIKTAMTTLSSKIVNRHHEHMAQIAVNAVLTVADFERKVRRRYSFVFLVPFSVHLLSSFLSSILHVPF